MNSRENIGVGKRKKPLVRLSIVLIAVVVAIPVGVVIESLIEQRKQQAFMREWTKVEPNVPEWAEYSFDGDGPINRTGEGVALKGYDVVAYFTENEAKKGREDFETVFKETIFRFSNEEHRDKFIENPERYIPAYGGFCALGVANGYKDDMHPEAFDVIDGRLFFNLSPGIHDHWKAHQEVFIARANENWPDLRHAPGYGPRDGR